MAVSPKEAAEDGAVASTFAGDGNDPHGGRLVVDHADGDLVGDQGGEGRGIGLAGNGDHIQADRADGGHGLELGECEIAAHGCLAELEDIFPPGPAGPQ